MDNRADRIVVCALAALLGVAFPAAGGDRTLLVAADFREAVRAYVMDGGDKNGEAPEIVFRSVPDSVRVDCARAVLRVGSGRRPRLKGYATFVVEVACGDTVERRYMVTARIRTFERVLVAARLIPARSLISGEDVRIVRMETTDIERPVLGDLASCGAQRARRIITRGSVLYHDLLEPIPVVSAGARVRVQAKAGAVQVTAEGIAREDGCRGDVIDISVGGRRERLKARVDDGHTVSVRVE